MFAASRRLAFLLVLLAPPLAAQGPDVPELPSGWTPKVLARAQHDMVAAAHPAAVAAARRILDEGGSALDAGIAAQLVLNLVEPQSSGIGGGGFLLYYDAARGRVASYDGRETAPAAAGADLFLDDEGQPLSFAAAVAGARAVGTPGLLRMLELAHRAHGRLPWQRLFGPAIELAYRGFPVSPRLAAALAGAAEICRESPAGRHFCDAKGRPLPAGARLRNPEFGRTLLELAYGGAGRFHDGPIARDIAAAVARHPRQPGSLAAADLARYRAEVRPPLCIEYRGRWRVCSVGPPSAGGVAVLQTLGLLQHFDLRRLPPRSPAAVHLVAEAYRLAYADRDRYLADSDFIAVPLPGLLDADYLRRRAARINPTRAGRGAMAGHPPGSLAAPGTPMGTEQPSTTHLSIVDRDGNALALTSSIERAFGSRVMVRGFLLNSELTDFAFAPTDAGGAPVANRVAPGKRPRSAMAPTLVFDAQGRLRLVLGSPGGGAIIQYVTRTLVGVLDWGLDIQQAIDLPHFGVRGDITVLERGRPVAGLKPALEALGHRIAEADLTSGLHGIEVHAEELAGGADPRREGMAAGR